MYSLIKKTLGSLSEDGFKQTIKKIKNYINGNSINIMNELEYEHNDNKNVLLVNDIKKVSVIIPNYNYETFLKQRLDTIINQTYPIYEVIFLDDKSSDQSVNLAKTILKNSKIRYEIVENDFNVGCFNQWINGIEKATGDFIWIAEADDYCEKNFVEKLICKFDDRTINLVYSQSKIVDESSNEINGFSYLKYTDDISEEKWKSDYKIDGNDEVLEALFIKNTIPNASAVIMRKYSLNGVEEKLKKYNIAGDWFTYVYCIKNGKMAFVSEQLNYHRRHSNSIVSRQEKKMEYYIEMVNIKSYIIENFNINSKKFEILLNHIYSEYERLGCIGYRNIDSNYELKKHIDELKYLFKQKVEKFTFLENTTSKNILVVCPDFEVGGGQSISIRLANMLSYSHNVYIYNSRPALVDLVTKNMISKRVTILDSLGTSLDLKNHILDNGIDIVNSHIWWADKIVFDAIKDLNKVKWVLSMHGCYEMLIKNKHLDKDFEIKYKNMFTRANKIIYASDKNLEIFNFDKEHKKSITKKIKKIYYGYNIQNIEPRLKSSIGIKDNWLVFGLISRAIESKGWLEAIKSIIMLNEKGYDAALVLVGDSEFQRKLKFEYRNYDYIHFIDLNKVGEEWISWIRMFDVGVLPTYFISETLPNTIIEYLAYEKPTISTDIGDIKYMLENKDYKAGIILKLKDYKVDIDDLSNAMEDIIKNKDLFDKYKKGTIELFRQFDANNFTENYYREFVREKI